MSNEQLSNCCSAPIRVGSGDEGTNWYECEKCNRPCDPFPKVEEGGCHEHPEGGLIHEYRYCGCDMAKEAAEKARIQSSLNESNRWGELALKRIDALTSPPVVEGETYQTAPIALHGKNITCSQCEPLTKEISTLKLELAEAKHWTATMTRGTDLECERLREALKRILFSEVVPKKIEEIAQSALTKLRSGG